MTVTVKEACELSETLALLYNTGVLLAFLIESAVPLILIVEPSIENGVVPDLAVRSTV